jgi:hypothetical protein
MFCFHQLDLDLHRENKIDDALLASCPSHRLIYLPPRLYIPLYSHVVLDQLPAKRGRKRTLDDIVEMQAAISSGRAPMLRRSLSQPSALRDGGGSTSLHLPAHAAVYENAIRSRHTAEGKKPYRIVRQLLRYYRYPTLP